MRVQRSAVVVSGDGTGVAGHAGSRLLVDLADRLGLTASLGVRPASRRARRSAHDPGWVLRDVAVMLADGGDCLSDLAVLRDQPEVFGPVASHATAWRTLEAVAADEFGVDAVRAARAAARRRAWALAGGPPLVDGLVCVDIDATFVTAHSDKDGAAGTYKGGFGFYPLLAYLDHGDGTGEPLGGVLRPGNAGSNTVLDHDDVLTLVQDQLPVDPHEVPVLVRADSAGASHGFLDALRAQGMLFSVGFGIDVRIRDAVAALPAVAWAPAVTSHGGLRAGAAVAELHGLDLAGYGWPSGTRVIVRREPLHPGAQPSLLDADGNRITCFVTDQPATDLAMLDLRHRGHARVEDRIRTAKDTGLRNLPFADFQRNAVWVELVLVAQDLLAFTQMLCLDGALAVAEPKTLRYRLLHVAARVARHARRRIIRLQASWPWTRQLLAAFRRVHAIPAIC